MAFPPSASAFLTTCAAMSALTKGPMLASSFHAPSVMRSMKSATASIMTSPFALSGTIKRRAQVQR